MNLSITYQKYIDRPDRITMDNGDYTISSYLPDGTLTKRSFTSKRIETVTKVNAKGDTIISRRDKSTVNAHSYAGSFWTLSGATTGRRVLTPAGYVDLTTGHRYWYLTNRQGSTMAVVDETGAVVQRNGYYPSGTPFVLPSEVGSAQAPSMTAVADQLHIGNRWLGHSGLDMYDNAARLHDPLLMRYASPDPLYGKNPDTSPWTHCAANPLNAIDPLGLDDYIINDSGEIVECIENDEQDRIIIQSNGNNIAFKAGTIIGTHRISNSKKIVDRSLYPDEDRDNKNADPNHPTIDYLRVRGDDNAVKIFEFLSDELDENEIEFTMVMTGLNGKKGLNFIGCSHLAGADNSSKILYDGMLKYGYTIRFWIHNHPFTFNPSKSDQNFINSINSKQNIIWAIYFARGTNEKYKAYNSTTIFNPVSSFKDL